MGEAVSIDEGPPIEGDWVSGALGNTGAWTIGVAWYDRPRSRYAMRVAPGHCNAFGMMHGGAMATFADAQLAAIRPPSDDPAGHTPTVTLTVDYLAPAPQGSWLILDASVLRTTRTLIFTQALVTIDGKPVARSSAIYRNAQGGTHP